jgi:hypothetical protein
MSYELFYDEIHIKTAAMYFYSNFCNDNKSIDQSI